MGIFQVFKKLGSTFIRVLPEYGHGALVLTGRQNFEIDVAFLEETMEVGQLGNNTNGSENRKWRRDDPVSHTRHHVTTTGGNFIDAGRKPDTLGANTVQLGSRKSV